MRLNRHHVIVGGGIILIFVLAIWAVHADFTDPIDSYAACANAGYQTFDTNPLSCSDGEHTFIGPSVSPAPSTPPISSVQFTILVDGDSKGRYAKSQQLITNEAQWQSYWAAVHSSLPKLPPIIPVNFALNNVVALSDGPQPTDGYNLEVTSIATSSIGTVVYATETVPTVTCHVNNVSSNRYYIVETPPLTQPVSYKVTSVKHQC
jgi:hypothetical protein